MRKDEHALRWMRKIGIIKREIVDTQSKYDALDQKEGMLGLAIVDANVCEYLKAEKKREQAEVVEGNVDMQELVDMQDLVEMHDFVREMSQPDQDEQ
mmetsp:Transcript_4986/g.6048  ORF Transcript_4986/g.6048 Transcript_4986/m.6048 type:complete len:97 (-) Transcript_4986:307-597(-)